MTMDPSELRRQMDSKAKKKDDVEDAVITDLPAVTSIEVDYTAKNKKRYQGRFIFTVPTLGHTIAITQLKAAMLPNGAATDPVGAFLAEMMCYLEITLAQEGRPTWWKPSSFYDADVLSHVYGRCRDYEKRFHGEIDSVKGSSSEEDAPGSDSPHQNNVEREVQSPAQRRTPLAAQGERGDRASAGAGGARGGTRRGG